VSCFYDVARDSSVGIATCYRLDDPGIESRWRVEIFRTPPVLSRAHPTPSTMAIGAFPRVKRPRLGAHHPPPSNTEFKERAELHLYFPSGPSWPVLGRNLALLSPVILTDSLNGGDEGAGGGLTPRSHQLHVDF
jgi:hypothetical protein